MSFCVSGLLRLPLLLHVKVRLSLFAIPVYALLVSNETYIYIIVFYSLFGSAIKFNAELIVQQEMKKTRRER